MDDYTFRKHRKWKRIFLSSLIAILNDETILAMAFNPVRHVTTDLNRYNSRGEKIVCEENLPTTITYGRKRRTINMNDSISEDVNSSDRLGHMAKGFHDFNRLKSKLASWSIQQLLAALNERRIRYAPTTSRTDLENLFMEYLIINNDCSSLDPYTDRPQEVDTDIKRAFLNKESSNPYKRSAASMPQVDLEERLQKRAHRRHQQQTRRDRFRNSMSNVLYSVVPSVTGNVLDYTQRKARRFKRQISDFMLLDEETGIRDVVRFDYIRRDQVKNGNSLKSEVVLGPGDAIEVILNEFQPLSSKGQARRSRLRDASLSDLYSTKKIHPPLDDVSSQQLDESYPSDRSNSLRLPPSLSAYSDPSTASFTSSSYAPPTKKKNMQAKKVYNPYSSDGRDITDNDKDAIDRVADFLTNAADQIFDRILVNDEDNNYSNYNNEAANADTTTRATDAATAFDETTTSRAQYQRGNGSKSNRKQHRKHWRDRLEERLDSMLGLHENGDFYRSWTERYEEDKDTIVGNDEPFDAFSVAQGRKPPKRSRKTLYDKPFWEEDGNMFSLLFGRTKHYTPPRLDLRLGLQTGSLLSIFRFAFQNVLVVASYLCRWASTQGALPQPVVVFGVGSAMLCARPHRRLFSAGIALLLLRTVGEVLHGYVYGSSGWEEDDDTTTTTTSSDKYEAETDDYNEEY